MFAGEGKPGVGRRPSIASRHSPAGSPPASVSAASAATSRAWICGEGSETLGRA
jgi:hypothetical protein